jgi:hypothetical protein
MAKITRFFRHVKFVQKSFSVITFYKLFIYTFLHPSRSIWKKYLETFSLFLGPKNSFSQRKTWKYQSTVEKNVFLYTFFFYCTLVLEFFCFAKLNSVVRNWKSKNRPPLIYIMLQQIILSFFKIKLNLKGQSHEIFYLWFFDKQYPWVHWFMG